MHGQFFVFNEQSAGFPLNKAWELHDSVLGYCGKFMSLEMAIRKHPAAVLTKEEWAKYQAWIEARANIA